MVSEWPETMVTVFPEVVAALYSERLSSSFFHSSVNPPLHTQGEVRQIRQGEGTRILAACVEKQVSPLKNLQSKMEGLSFENVAACMILNSELCSLLTGGSISLLQSKKRRGRPKKQDKVPLIIESDDESEIVSLCTCVYAHHIACVAISLCMRCISFPDWQIYNCKGTKPWE